MNKPPTPTTPESPKIQYPKHRNRALDVEIENARMGVTLRLRAVARLPKDACSCYQHKLNTIYQNSMQKLQKKGNSKRQELKCRVASKRMRPAEAATATFGDRNQGFRSPEHLTRAYSLEGTLYG